MIGRQHAPPPPLEVVKVVTFVEFNKTHCLIIMGTKMLDEVDRGWTLLRLASKCWMFQGRRR